MTEFAQWAQQKQPGQRPARYHRLHRRFHLVRARGRRLPAQVVPRCDAHRCQHLLRRLFARAREVRAVFYAAPRTAASRAPVGAAFAAASRACMPVPAAAYWRHHCIRIERTLMAHCCTIDEVFHCSLRKFVLNAD